MSACLFINSKWRGTPIYEAISKIQFRCFFDDSLDLLDFKVGSTGLCYIEKSSSLKPSISEYRKSLAKVFNNHPNLKIQALVDYSNKELFNSIQELTVIELKIQVIPIESYADLAQYIERFIVSEFQEDKNPFLKDLIINTNDSTVTSQYFLNCLRNIPKIGEKNAQLIAKTYKNLKNLSNAAIDDLIAKIGGSNAKIIYDFFHNAQ